jgi:hypothetical protein
MLDRVAAANHAVRLTCEKPCSHLPHPALSQAVLPKAVKHLAKSADEKTARRYVSPALAQWHARRSIEVCRVSHHSLPNTRLAVSSGWRPSGRSDACLAAAGSSRTTSRRRYVETTPSPVLQLTTITVTLTVNHKLTLPRTLIRSNPAPPLDPLPAVSTLTLPY